VSSQPSSTSLLDDAEPSNTGTSGPENSGAAGPPTQSLAEFVSVNARFARSANLERDADRAEPLDGYVVTPRALDVMRRVAHAAAEGSAGGAWAVPGPYGSGKSSLALLLDTAFGPAGSAREPALARAGAAEAGHDPNAIAVMGDWTSDDFGQLRLQYNRESLASGEQDDQVILQYTVTPGGHHGHDH